MPAHLRRPALIFALALLLGVLLFLFDIARPAIHLWAGYLVPVVVVYFWGRRRDLYIVAGCMSLLILAGYWLEPSPPIEDAFANQLVPVVVLWVIAWLFSQHMQMQAEMVRQQQALAEQVAARTAELQASEQRYRLLAESASDSLRLQAEEALRRSEDRFAKIFRASPAGILLRREADGCVLDCNDAYLQVSGYSYDEVIGHTIPQLGIVTPALNDHVTAILQEQGHIDSMDIQIVNKAGETLDVNCLIERLEFEGEPCHLVIGYDIGDRKRMELELRRLNEALEESVGRRTADLQAALDELQRASKLKDEFMAMISHELRTPLSGVLSMAEMLQDQFAGPLNQRQAVYVRAIEQSGQRLLDVVNSILSYTYLVGGQVQLQREHCKLAYLLSVCAVSQRVKSDAKQQTLQVLVEPPDLSVETDPAAVAEVLKRLLDNAIKFTPEGGQIGLEAHAGPTPGSVQLVVWDTGRGIAAGQVDRIFQPLTQGDASLARGHEGMGMGLAYVQRMLALLGGQLDLEPNLPRGSRFIVTLPAVQQDDAVFAQKQSSP